MESENFTFKMIAATNITAFEDLVNEYLEKGYRFMGTPVLINRHETVNGWGYQYSIPMLLKEGEGVA